MFNNNSAQILQQNQGNQATGRTYNTRSSSNSQNIFQNSSQNNSMGLSNNSGNTGSNLFSNQNQGSNNIIMGNNTSGGSNLFQNNSQSTGNIFQTSGGSNKNIFSGSSQAPQISLGQNNEKFMTYRVQQEVLKVMSSISQMTQNAQFQKLIILIEKILERHKQTTQKISKDGENLKKESTDKAAKDRKLIEQKCKIIKQKNHFLLVSMFNFKQKMMHKMYQHKVRAPQLEEKVDQIFNKIKQISANVKQKKNQFYLQKKFKVPTPEKQKSQQKYKSIDRPMVQLREAVQILGRETLRLRCEFDLCCAKIHK